MCELGFSGAPYDMYLKSTLKNEDLTRYKLVVYISPYEVTSYDVDFMKSLIKNKKVVLLTGRKYIDNAENLINVPNCVSANELKKYFKQAGVHIYSDESAVIYKSPRHICITATKDSDYVINLKSDCTLTSFITGKKIKTENKKAKITLKYQQSELFIIE
jgi:hypothetical protein